MRETILLNLQTSRANQPATGSKSPGINKRAKRVAQITSRIKSIRQSMIEAGESARSRTCNRDRLESLESPQLPSGTNLKTKAHIERSVPRKGVNGIKPVKTAEPRPVTGETILAVVIRHYGTGLYRAVISPESGVSVVIGTYEDEVQAGKRILEFRKLYDSGQIDRLEEMMRLEGEPGSENKEQPRLERQLAMLLAMLNDQGVIDPPQADSPGRIAA